MKNWLRQRKILRKIENNKKKLESFTSRESANILTKDKIKHHKKSNTLCVLASGKSINEITDTQWDFINQSDSLSLNNTILHKFVPTYLFYETDTDDEIHRDLSLLKFENLVQRADDFRDVPIIWHYQEKRYFDIEKLRKHNLLKNSFFQTSFSLPGDTPEDFKNSLRFVSDKGVYKEINIGLYRRGSLARILHFALAMGYEEVVFFGADLVNADYFFDSYTKEDLPEGCRLPNMKDYSYNSKEGVKTQHALHMTVDKSVHPVTMFDVIEAMNNTWLKPSGILLQIASNSSALKSILPLKSWD